MDVRRQRHLDPDTRRGLLRRLPEVSGVVPPHGRPATAGFAFHAILGRRDTAHRATLPNPGYTRKGETGTTLPERNKDAREPNPSHSRVKPGLTPKHRGMSSRGTESWAQGMNLSGSRQQGHSAAHNTLSRSKSFAKDPPPHTLCRKSASKTPGFSSTPGPRLASYGSRAYEALHVRLATHRGNCIVVTCRHGIRA